jgi:hypothetical protein
MNFMPEWVSPRTWLTPEQWIAPEAKSLPWITHKPGLIMAPTSFDGPVKTAGKVSLIHSVNDLNTTDNDDEMHAIDLIDNRRSDPKGLISFTLVGSGGYDAGAALHQYDRIKNPDLEPIHFFIGKTYDKDKTPRNANPSFIDGQPIVNHASPQAKYRIRGYHPERFDKTGEAMDGSGKLAVDETKFENGEIVREPSKRGEEKYAPLASAKFVPWIMKKLENGTLGRIAQFQLAPHKEHTETIDLKEWQEHGHDVSQKAWDHLKSIPKLNVFQYHLKPNPESGYELAANNYTLSDKDLLLRNLAHMGVLENTLNVLVDGGNSKRRLVTIAGVQKKLPGIQARFDSCQEIQKRAWADNSHTITAEDLGSSIVPEITEISLGVLTKATETPTGLNASGAHPIGMNVDRVLDEAGYKKGTVKREKARRELLNLINTLDEHTIDKLHENPNVSKFISSPLEKMDAATRSQYGSDVGRESGLSPTAWLIRSHLVEVIKDKLEGLTKENQTYYVGKTIKPHAFEKYPYLQDVTNAREQALNDEYINGNSFVGEFVAIIKRGKPEQYGYDPRAASDGRMLAKSENLQKIFGIGGNFCNVEATTMSNNPKAAEWLDYNFRNRMTAQKYVMKYSPTLWQRFNYILAKQLSLFG